MCRAAETRAGAVLEAVEARGDRDDVRMVAGRVIDLGDVCAEEPVLGVSRPLGYPGELALGERGDLAVHVEPVTVRRRSCQPEVDEPLQRRRQAAALTRTGAEPERAGQLAGIDLSRDTCDPECREPAEQQRRARSDDGGPALLDVGVGQREPDPAYSRVGVIDRGELQGSIVFHAAVGL